jgi:uncharacterized protein (TIGR02466 family)
MNNYFQTPIWVEIKEEFLKSSIKNTDKYIKEAYKTSEEQTKKTKGFGLTYHSVNLFNDNNFRDLTNYINQKSIDFLNIQGFKIDEYKTVFSEMWVQEFSRKGGGHHSIHTHPNNHVSGFYFLKCSENTSYPIFHDPRSGAVMTKLKEKNILDITPASSIINFRPKPGTLIIFPSYLPHEYAVDDGSEPFRFIHFNIQAIEKGMLKNV